MRITDRLAIVAAAGALLLAAPERAGADPADLAALAPAGRGVAPAEGGFVQVPEPTTALTLGLGLAVLAAHRRRERRAARRQATGRPDGWQTRALSGRPIPPPAPPRPGAGRPASGA